MAPMIDTISTVESDREYHEDFDELCLSIVGGGNYAALQAPWRWRIMLVICSCARVFV